jgi:Kelch motif.
LKNSSEVFNEAIEAWVPGPVLPNQLYDHCMVQINSTHTAVIGGYSTMERILAETWIYNWASQTWSQQPDMKVPRDDHYCALLPGTWNATFSLTLTPA